MGLVTGVWLYNNLLLAMNYEMVQFSRLQQSVVTVYGNNLNLALENVHHHICA